MTIKHLGGIFGRNPTFYDVDVNHDVNIDGGLVIGEPAVPLEDIHISRATGDSSPDPVEIRMETSTQGSSWSTTEPWARFSYYNTDTSGGGGKIHAAIDCVAFHVSGGRSSLRFKTTLNSGDTLADCLVLEPDQGSGRHVEVADGNLKIGTSGKGIEFTDGPFWSVGSGTPEGNVTADVGSLYTRTDGGANTTLYVKESGSGNTGWIAK